MCAFTRLFLFRFLVQREVDAPPPPKVLTPEEKAAKLDALKAKMKDKRAAKEVANREEHKEKEKVRHHAVDETWSHCSHSCSTHPCPSGVGPTKDRSRGRQSQVRLRRSPDGQARRREEAREGSGEGPPCQGQSASRSRRAQPIGVEEGHGWHRNSRCCSACACCSGRAGRASREEGIHRVPDSAAPAGGFGRQANHRQVPGN